MGLFDRLRSALGRVGGAVDFAGPLRLSPGDRVAWYRERWSVAGVRVLVGERFVVHQYLLRGNSGPPVVLSAEQGEEPTLFLERPEPEPGPDARAAADGASDAELRVTRSGRVRAHVAGEGEVAGVERTLGYRRFADADGDRIVIVEEAGSRREFRTGEPVLEAEFEFERRGSDEAAPCSVAADAPPSEDAERGSPAAAARALTGESASDRAAAGGPAAPAPERATAEDVEPGFEDESWDDEEFRPDAAERADLEAADGTESEADAWVAAAEYLRDGAAGG